MHNVIKKYFFRSYDVNAMFTNVTRKKVTYEMEYRN